LAVSDVGMLGTLVWLNLCFNPLFHNLDLPFDSVEIQYLTAGWPHVVFTQITSWITAFITLERCLCIALPLKASDL
ncbi:allatostatin-A receptor, partial [Biomphalaria pfeifferi]